MDTVDEIMDSITAKLQLYRTSKAVNVENHNDNNNNDDDVIR